LRAPVSSFNTAVLVAFGRMGSVSFISLLSIAIGTVFLFVGVNFGLIGVAAALALRQWALWPVGAFQVYRVSGMRSSRQLWVLLIAALPSLIMAAAVWAADAMIEDLPSRCNRCRRLWACLGGVQSATD
jgi:O-antigen/teichoic acid export membrane protein